MAITYTWRMRSIPSLLLALILFTAAPTRADKGHPAPHPKQPAFLKMKVREVRQHRPGVYAVILQSPDRNKILPIWIGRREAQAIQLRLSKARLPRPLTHELLESVVAILGAKVVRVEVMALRDKVFIGKVDLQDAQGKRYRLDGRPSDLITLAVGAGIQVHVAREVLDQAGVDISGDEPKKAAKKTSL